MKKQAEKTIETNLEKETFRDYKKRNLKSTIIVTVVVFLVCLIVFATVWIMTTWPVMEVYMIMYQIRAPLGGASASIVRRAVMMILFPSLGVSSVFAVLMFLAPKKSVYRWARGLSILAAVIGLAASAASLWNWVGLSEYLALSSQQGTVVDDNFVDPAKLLLVNPETGKKGLESPIEKRNMLTIFLESTEISFTETTHGGGEIDVNYIPELTDIAMENEDFSGSANNQVLDGGYVVPGTGWTIGSLFGHTSGLPLLTGNNEGRNNGMADNKFFAPNLTTMGDILYEDGYENIFFCGSPAVFGGRSLYFTEHHYSEIRDLDYYRKANWLPDENYYDDWWGFEDRYLFDGVQGYPEDPESIDRDTMTWDQYGGLKWSIHDAASRNQPFNYTVLTVDTHFENGHSCPECETEEGNVFFDDHYGNVFACSSKRVADFIEDFKKHEPEVYANTTIVLLGDHPTMDADFCAAMPIDYTRLTYVSYVNLPEGLEPEIDSRRMYTAMDAFPTMMRSLGYTIEGHRLGLGTDLFSDKMTIMEEYILQEGNSYEDFCNDFLRKSEVLSWAFTGPARDITWVSSSSEE